MSFILLLVLVQLFWKLEKSYRIYFATEKKTVTITPAQAKDEVQKDARNIPDPFIRDYWNPKTSIKEGIENIYRGMKQYYE